MLIQVDHQFKRLLPAGDAADRQRQSARFSSIIGVLAPTAVGGYDFLKPPCDEPTKR